VHTKPLVLIVLGSALVVTALSCVVSLVTVFRFPKCVEVALPAEDPTIIAKGTVILHGGGGSTRALALAILNATGRERPRVGVIPTAMDDPINTGLAWVRYLERFGVEAVLLNITVDNCAWTSHNKDVVELMRSLDAVFFLGGLSG